MLIDLIITLMVERNLTTIALTSLDQAGAVHLVHAAFLLIVHNPTGFVLIKRLLGGELLEGLAFIC